jgi:hypothetical protein
LKILKANYRRARQHNDQTKTDWKKSSLRKVLPSPSWLWQPLHNICVANDNGDVLFVVITIPSFPDSWLITISVALVKQELPTFPEHLSSHPGCSGVLVSQSLVSYVVFCKSWFVLFSFGHRTLCVYKRLLVTPLVSSNLSWTNVIAWKPWYLQTEEDTNDTYHNTTVKYLKVVYKLDGKRNILTDFSWHVSQSII